MSEAKFGNTLESWQEVAEETNVNPHTTKSLLERGRKLRATFDRLHDHLHKNYGQFSQELQHDIDLLDTQVALTRFMLICVANYGFTPESRPKPLYEFFQNKQ